MQINENFSLKQYNTFGIDVSTRYFIEYQTEKELHDLLAGGLPAQPVFSLGAGSNLLFTHDYEGVMLHSQIKDIEPVEEHNDCVLVRAGAGVVWDDFVAYCVEKGWGGVENLSLIPGTVGASPVQNIGAYGVEAKDVVCKVDGVSFGSNSPVSFTNADCKFGYRDSAFKHLDEKIIVTYVNFRLSKKPEFKLEYGTIKEELKKYETINLQTIRRAIISIRESKLPDPVVMGNAGSFFKNPVVSKMQFEQLATQYPTIPHYTVSEQEVKIPAAWLIEQSGWKGKSCGNVGVHDKQPLVLINKGNATGDEVVKLSNQIRSSVEAKFNIKIYPEVIFL
ncbi:MAG: UDP-N-acetylmuramate dehydrogenase [Paludibacteraceae bacterium]|nr:UDP-N-acetylmuramate dehydrogenase [Paludibacteraceae bacterium]